MPNSSTAYEYMQKAHGLYQAAHRNFLWWLAGIGYAVFCLFIRDLPGDLHEELGYLVLLNRWGAFVVGLVCAGFAVDAYRHRREALWLYRAQLKNWSDERAKAGGG